MSDDTPKASVVRVRGLRKSYGRITAVDGLDMEVPRGAVFGLLGPNGAGKSTTFGILCGWLKPSAGEVEVLGTRCTHLYRLRGRVAALPQDSQFPAQVAVIDQLAHFARLMGKTAAEARREADRVLERVDLRRVARMRGDELSHGMAKRVGLAQALIGPPEVVFLDEPTAGLDPRSAHEVKAIIGELTPRTTVILSSHNLVDVQAICSHGTVIHHGRVVASGSMDSLTRRGNQISVTLKPGSEPDMAVLSGRFGGDNVRLGRGDDETTLTIGFAADRDVSAVIAEALELLLSQGMPILGVNRGTSLEAAFLEVTSAEAGASA